MNLIPMKKTLALLMVALAVSVTATAVTRQASHAENRPRPNLIAAQRLVQQAYDKLRAGLRANEGDLGGHGAKAVELLDQAAAELKLSLEESNPAR